jgi:hypothetical protein
MKHLSPAEIETIRVPEPKHDPFTLESLVAWLEMMPGDSVYCFQSNGNCLLAQYFIAHGFRYVNMGPAQFFHGQSEPNEKASDLPPGFNNIAVGHPRTFGAALTRARAALASQKGDAPCP